MGTMVLPARLAFDLDPNDSVDQVDLTYPEPIGVLRLLVKSGRDLRGDDFVFTGGKTSDPYVIVALGQQTWRSKTVNKSTSPVWAHGNITDFLVFDREQEMKVTVFDEDLLSADDLLGAASDLIAERFIGRPAPVDETLPLKFDGEPAGDLTISTRWFHLTRDVSVTTKDQVYSVSTAGSAKTKAGGSVKKSLRELI